MCRCCSTVRRGSVAAVVMESSVDWVHPRDCDREAHGVKAGHAMMPVVRTARFALAVVAGVLALLGPSPTAQAQEIEPRAYSNIPVGLNFMALGYVHSQGALSFYTSVPVENAHLRIDGTFLAYVRSFGFFGRSANVAVAFPYAW